jgi:hypothetical protein
VVRELIPKMGLINHYFIGIIMARSRTKGYGILDSTAERGNITVVKMQLAGDLTLLNK